MTTSRIHFFGMDEQTDRFAPVHAGLWSRSSSARRGVGVRRGAGPAARSTPAASGYVVEVRPPAAVPRRPSGTTAPPRPHAVHAGDGRPPSRRRFTVSPSRRPDLRQIAAHQEPPHARNRLSGGSAATDPATAVARPAAGSTGARRGSVASPTIRPRRCSRHERDAPGPEELADWGARTRRTRPARPDSTRSAILACQATRPSGAPSPCRRRTAWSWREFRNGRFRPASLRLPGARGFVMEIARSPRQAQPLPLEGPGHQTRDRPVSTSSRRTVACAATSRGHSGRHRPDRGPAFDRECSPSAAQARVSRSRPSDHRGQDRSVAQIPKDRSVLDGAVCSGNRSADR